MKCFFAFAFFCLISIFAVGQDRGVIECQGRMSVPAWSEPGSKVVAKQFDCGSAVTILGVDRGYVKVQSGDHIGYVEAVYVRSAETEGDAERRIAELEAVVKRLQEKTSRIDESRPVKSDLAVEIQGSGIRSDTEQENNNTEIQRLPSASPIPPSPADSTTQTDADSTIFGDGKIAQPPEAEDEGPRRHLVSLSFEVSNIYYDEPHFMRNKGFMYGVSGDYTYRPNSFSFKLDGRFSYGNVDYWSDGTGTAKDLRDYNFETRFALGYELKTGSRKAVFTPFMGLGFRYLFDGLSSAGPGGYDRKSNYLYSPIGMETMFHLGRGWSLGLTGEYDLFWHGWQYSEIADAGLGFVPLKNDQNDGLGARGSLKIIRQLRKLDFAIEPYFRYWDIEGSDIDLDVQYLPYYDIFLPLPAWEPGNTTTEWGLKIGIRF